MLRVLLVLSLLASPLSAGTCNVGAVRSRAVYNQQAVVVQQAVAYAPAVVVKQVYPNLYWTVGQSVQEAAQFALIRKAVREELRQELKSLQMRSVPQDPEAQKALGLQVLERSCIKCHTVGSKAVVEQEAPAFFTADGVFNATPEQRGAIGAVVKKGVMPPPPADALDDDSYLAIKQFLNNSGK